MSATGALVNNFDYSQWYAEQEYLPGAYPSLDDLTFLGWSDRAQYTSCLRFQYETMRVHETIAPTEATCYDITDMSRHVPGYWPMMLELATVDRVWRRLYGNITTPRSFNSRWSRTKKMLKDLIIKNERAADAAWALQAVAVGRGNDDNEDEE